MPDKLTFLFKISTHQVQTPVCLTRPFCQILILLHKLSFRFGGGVDILHPWLFWYLCWYNSLDQYDLQLLSQPEACALIFLLRFSIQVKHFISYPCALLYRLSLVWDPLSCKTSSPLILVTMYSSICPLNGSCREFVGSYKAILLILRGKSHHLRW